MQRTNNKAQQGSSVIAISLIILVAAVIAYAGYMVMNKQAKTPASTTNTTAQSNTTPEKVENAADVNAANKSLDEMDAQLDSDLNTSSLDEDINSL